ncbi:iron ABC transporter permease [Viridibacillus sp. FSL R5-0477]|uniref:ABC transporter permease n=1 Tax=Viridibacillus arenosi FSL R5-213 TaxID=1227360 RepID=W4F1R7_9BACL|nr:MULTISPECIES: iron ABC transporter permease [Viridibacillus]ETT86404.1 ABC transporter permease [Viridibacillus arenosi FSL R5-213]OMC82698.1 iron ABC transporter permease [Viridibacillus sp. FSL H7-0596]OMC84710.1 iron ABC transporter permease [Viridibacillus sp. FSL H8-0123]OMC91756.1 iron ABC transporter permease [Viridibacillus arenosi]
MRKNTLKWAILLLLPILFGFLSLSIGRYQVDLVVQMKILLSHVFDIEQTWSQMEETVVMKIRLPRILLAMLIGGGLSIAGAAFQSMFANPLVSPDILGVSAGAGFGASLGILIIGHGFTTQIFALIMGILAILFTFIISGMKKNMPIFMMVLAGVVTSALFQALISLVKFVSDPEEKLPSITYWLMGSLGTASYKDLWVAGPLILIGIIILYALRWRMNILSLSDEEARSLGVSTTKLKWLVIFAATLITASAVSISGIIGWVGLIIPHIARMIVGSNNQYVLPASVSIGAIYLLVIDTLARSITATEIPLSILTAIVGAPFFAILLRKTGGGWQ